MGETARIKGSELLKTMPSGIKSQGILLVDNDHGMNLLNKMRFEDEGLNVVGEVDNYSKAQAHVSLGLLGIAVIILDRDLKSPEGNGVDIYKKVQQNPELKVITIACCGLIGGEKEPGYGEFFVPKPHDEEDMFLAVANALTAAHVLQQKNNSHQLAERNEQINANQSSSEGLVA
ncbi:MAG: hypothetical protein HYW86_03055 [Candidatus Roizmanbacteria bacterium]|nr:MAG: hypothetical protein HYW86_03055 [Candidatus Roizmanbacteria bacterium]